MDRPRAGTFRFAETWFWGRAPGVNQNHSNSSRMPTRECSANATTAAEGPLEDKKVRIIKPVYSYKSPT